MRSLYTLWCGKKCVFRWFGIFSIPWASKWAPRRSFVHEMSKMMPEIKMQWLQNSDYLESDGSKRILAIFSTLQSPLGRSGCNGLREIWLADGAKVVNPCDTRFPVCTSDAISQIWFWMQIISLVDSGKWLVWANKSPRNEFLCLANHSRVLSGCLET